MHIYDISLERITRQYLEYLDAFKQLNIELAGEFVVMAANLIYLKSRSLLPVDQQPPEEDVEEDDPRWELIRQLIEYKKFKEAAAQLHVRELEQERMFTRDGGAPASLQEAPLRLGEVGIFQLINAFQNVISGYEAREDLREIFGEHFTVSDEDHVLESINELKDSDLTEPEGRFLQTGRRSAIAREHPFLLQLAHMQLRCRLLELLYSINWRMSPQRRSSSSTSSSGRY